MKQFFRIITALLLLAALALNAVSCRPSASPLSPEGGASPAEAALKPVNSASPLAKRYADFAVKLLGAGDGGNALVSPLSVMCALGMTMNGAKGETRAQLEQAIGMTTEELNSYFESCGLLGEDGALRLADSIWLNGDGLNVDDDFINLANRIFRAEVFRTPFDEKMREDLNAWVELRTSGMIKEILDRVPADAAMYLVNALAFEAEWEKVYEERDLSDGIFTCEDGTEVPTSFMNSAEDTLLKTDLAKGFMKPYKGGRYAFAALLPNEGVSVKELLASLENGKLNEVLVSAENARVHASMPKFEAESSFELSDFFKGLGCTVPFDSTAADFTGISADAGLYIGRILHKTHISVFEQGTKAGAATVVEMLCGSALVEKTEEVKLDRPFVYMLVDCETNQPFFIGTMMDVEG